MARVQWNQPGEHWFEMGVDRGVLYPGNGLNPVPWNGLSSVSQAPTGGEARPYYIDGYKYANRSSPEEFEGTIEAFTYPDEFERCNGMARPRQGLFIGQQRRGTFGLSYRTGLGNDIEGLAYGYKIHLIYNAMAGPDNKTYSSNSDSPEAANFSWSFTTKPIRTPGYRPISYMCVDASQVAPQLVAALEDILYGSETTSPRLPTPAEVVQLFVEWPVLYVSYNDDGVSYTIHGPDDMVKIIDSSTFEITADSAVDNGDGTFNVTSA